MNAFEKTCAVIMFVCLSVVGWANGRALNKIEQKISPEPREGADYSYGENIAPGVWRYSDKEPEKPSQGQVYTNPNGWTQPPLYTENIAEMFNRNRPLNINVDVYHHNYEEAEDGELAPRIPPAPAAAEYESAEPEGFASRLQTASLRKYHTDVSNESDLEVLERSVRGLYEIDRTVDYVPLKSSPAEKCVPNTFTWPPKVLYNGTANNE